VTRHPTESLQPSGPPADDSTARGNPEHSPPQEIESVSEPSPSRPSLDEIAVVFAHLADRVAAERARSLDPVIRLSMARAALIALSQ
jgi:hypothetical protein